MKIHEHQGKELFRNYQIPTPNGLVAFGVEEAIKAASALQGPPWVVKAQIHAGGRGKGGGVKLAQTSEEVRSLAKSIFGMKLVTPQTGPEGKEVKRLLIEEGADIAKEHYLAITLDRTYGKLVIIASQAGGMDIEKIAEETPQKIFHEWVSPDIGLRSFQTRRMAQKMGYGGNTAKEFGSLLPKLVKLFIEKDCSLVEVNPLVVTGKGSLVALDAKINFDENALFRHPDSLALRDPNEEDANEAQAKKFDLSYISLDGNIGCMVNGAGLAMATLDIIKLEGGNPANFLDVGGGATEDRVREAFKIILQDSKVRAILVNIFGGIMKCDVIATGIVSAAKELNLAVPLIVRLEGTNVDIGKKILSESGLKIVSATGMKEAAHKAVTAIGVRK